MFTIADFLESFKLSETVKEHLKETVQEFYSYLDMLMIHSSDTINWFLYDYLVNEVFNSYNLENQLYDESVINLYEQNDLNNISTEEMIKLINATCRENERAMTEEQFDDLMKKRHIDKTYQEYRQVLTDNPPGQYRNRDIWLGNPGEGVEHAFHIPPPHQEIKLYMKDFIDFVNAGSYQFFIESALIHMYFIKIHPFSDGNGRTIRFFVNDYIKRKVEQNINRGFKYPIINLSSSLNISKLNYLRKQNDIIFESGIDNNEPINKWIDFILNMYDEQIYFLKNKLQKYDELLATMDANSRKQK